MPPRMKFAYKVLCVIAIISLFSTILFAEFLQISIPAFIIFVITVFILGGVKK